MKGDDVKLTTAKKYAIFAVVPFILAVPPMIGWLIGSWLDRLFNTDPYLMFLFIVFGFISAFREFYRLIKKYGKV